MPLNEVFQAIKKFSTGSERIDVSECQKTIELTTQITGRELLVYFDILENMKVIMYTDSSKKSIFLTDTGMRLEKLPSLMSNLTA